MIRARRALILTRRALLAPGSTFVGKLPGATDFALRDIVRARSGGEASSGAVYAGHNAWRIRIRARRAVHTASNMTLAACEVLANATVHAVRFRSGRPVVSALAMVYTDIYGTGI